MAKKALFLDRDGTIIIDKVYLNDPDKIEYLDRIFEALKRFRDAGFVFIIVTNQSGIARGIVSIENLDAIHAKIQADFAQQGIDVSRFYYAPQSVESQHWQRKPNPGMLLSAAADHDIDFSQSWMIGDRTTDVTAGQRAGCFTVYLTGSEPDTAIKTLETAPNLICTSVYEAADHILG